MKTWPERITKLEGCPPVADGTTITLLPGGYVLINATPTEDLIVALFAAECLRLKPPTVEAVTSD